MTINDSKIKCHGMANELVEPNWSPITLEDLKQLLMFYPQFKEATNLTWHSPRPFSSATIAVIDQNPFFVKRHATFIRDVEGLQEEHGLLTHLHKEGIPVSRVIKGMNEQTAFSIENWTYEIHLLGEGVDLYRDAVSWSPFISLNHAFAAGKKLAEVHIASEKYHKNKRKIQPLVCCFEIWNNEFPLEKIQEFMIGRPGLSSYLENKNWKTEVENTFYPFYEKFYPLSKNLTPIWTHNDWHASNLLWTSDGEQASVATVLDFGLSNVTNAVYDLATAIERNIVEWLHLNEREEVVHYDSLEQLLKGYFSIKTFSDEEKNALCTILPLVHTEFALSEIDYFERIIQSHENADAAYETYLLGHARWFNTSEGKKLLSKLHKTVNNLH